MFKAAPGADDGHMIRVATLDRQPAVRAGLESTIAAQPDLFPVGTAADEHELWPLLQRTRPDVVVVDDPSLIDRIKAWKPSPRVVVYADRAETKGDGLVGRGADLRLLLDAIRAVVHMSMLRVA